MATQIARHWRIKSQRYQLAGHICSQCNTSILQSRVVCPTCANKDAQSTTTVHNLTQPPLLIQVPHPDGLVIYHRKFNPTVAKSVNVKRPPTPNTI